MKQFININIVQLLEFVYAAFSYFCIQLTPRRLVDTVVPHLLINVYFLGCLEDTLLAVWGSVSGIE